MTGWFFSSPLSPFTSPFAGLRRLDDSGGDGQGQLQNAVSFQGRQWRFLKKPRPVADLFCFFIDSSASGGAFQKVLSLSKLVCKMGGTGRTPFPLYKMQGLKVRFQPKDWYMSACVQAAAAGPEFSPPAAQIPRKE